MIDYITLQCQLKMIDDKYVLSMKNIYNDNYLRTFRYDYIFSLDQDYNNCWKSINENFKTYSEDIAELFVRHMLIDLINKEKEKGSP